MDTEGAKLSGKRTEEIKFFICLLQLRRNFFMSELTAILTTIDSAIWGLPLIILLLGTGIYFTFRLGFYT